MTKELNLANAKGIDFAHAPMSLWTFKRKAGGGFTAYSVTLSEALDAKIRAIAVSSLGHLSEVEDYGLLVQPNEVGCLYVSQDETILDTLLTIVSQPPEDNVIKDLKNIQNSIGYVVRFWSSAGSFYAFKKVGADWVTKKKTGVINAVIRANQLELVEEPSLVIYHRFDFYAVDDAILVVNKAAFESLLSYKIEYQNSFSNLQNNVLFVNTFVNMAPLIAHVGTNTMHLRRMAVIEQKAHFANPQYMDRLRSISAQRGWKLVFDATGKIVVTEDSLRDIMQVLLNHRLYSELSLDSWDVPSASQVS